jgi:hypothetical protein
VMLPRPRNSSLIYLGALRVGRLEALPRLQVELLPVSVEANAIRIEANSLGRLATPFARGPSTRVLR